MLGTTLDGYQTVDRAMISRLLTLLGQFDLAEIRQAYDAAHRTLRRQLNRNIDKTNDRRRCSACLSSSST